ncbi:hypothetical protein THAOC_17776, partial [Thalassiosira oceanica]
VRPQIEFSAVDLSPEKDLQHRLEVLALATDGEERCPMEARPFQHLQLQAQRRRPLAAPAPSLPLPAGGVEHEDDAPVAHPRPGYRSRSITGPTAVDRRRWFGRERCNGRGIRPDRGAPRPAVLARRQARSTTTQHDLTPPLRRYGRSGARGPSIYLGREPDAATSIPDGAADVKFIIPAVALACY